jgi:magnesium chelatase subunit D
LTEAPSPGLPLAPSAADDALLAVALFAVDPSGTGLILRGPAGPARDVLLDTLRLLLPAGTPWRRMPPNVTSEALDGGIDVTATLQTGRRVQQDGLLRQAAHGILVAAMAERLPLATAAHLAASLDSAGTPFGLVALDEGLEDEALPPALLDRLAFPVDVTAMSYRAFADVKLPTPDDIVQARALLPGVDAGEEIVEALCGTALALGAGFVRAPLQALAAAKAAAALDGRREASLDDAAVAARLVLAPRATRLPAEPPPPDQPEPPPDNPPEDNTPETESLAPDAAEIVLEAARAAIPPGLLALLESATTRTKRAATGRAGARQRGTGRGRPAGVRAAVPSAGLRLSLVETLRAAAPWQNLRARTIGNPEVRVKLRRDDFRVIRTEHQSRSTTIFVVDASGSSAINRLAEAKGAVELLLADCYKRRDQVAVIAFRGKTAELLLPPTRSLTRAKRSLSGLPGGGATPLAAGLDAGFLLAEATERGGATPIIVLLTDGKGNIALSGEASRAQAGEDAKQAALRLRARRHKALLIDISPRPNPQAKVLAQQMGARYLPLPFAGAAAVSAAVRGLG